MNTNYIPVPKVLYCPQCSALHIDKEEWATRLHKSHLCEVCNYIWRPFDYYTVGTEEHTFDGIPQSLVITTI